MDRKLGAVGFALGLLVGFGTGSATTRVASADVRANADGSCGTSTPCLTESNTAGGAGVKSTSAHGDGLIATTKATGSTSTNGGSALLGQDLQTTSGKGLFNFGVSGTSTYGTGVQGSGAVGVLALTTNASGMLFEGSGSAIGSPTSPFFVDAEGRATFGLVGTTNNSGAVTVNGNCGDRVPFFSGNSQTGQLFTVNDCGEVLAAQVNAGLVISTGSVEADQGLFSGSETMNSANYIADDAAGITWLYQGYSATAGKYTVEMGDSGSVYARIFITMNELRVAQPTATGSRVDTYAPQTAQPSLEDFGEAQLNGGSATVALDAKFASAIDNSVRYYVMLTPEGDCRGLYVAQRNATNFTVRELQGGRSSIAFTYRIVAKPLGDNSPRLPQSTLPYGFEHRVPPPRRALVYPRANATHPKHVR